MVVPDDKYSQANVFTSQIENSASQHWTPGPSLTKKKKKKRRRKKKIDFHKPMRPNKGRGRDKIKIEMGGPTEFKTNKMERPSMTAA